MTNIILLKIYRKIYYLGSKISLSKIVLLYQQIYLLIQINIV